MLDNGKFIFIFRLKNHCIQLCLIFHIYIILKENDLNYFTGLKKKKKDKGMYYTFQKYYSTISLKMLFPKYGVHQILFMNQDFTYIYGKIRRI